MRIPIAKDAWRFVVPAVAAGALLLPWPWGRPFAVLAFLFAGFSLYFFRDFDRATVVDANILYSPGDGKVMEVGTVPEGDYQGWLIIRIFLSVFDVHVQRSPVAGVIRAVEYRKGQFLDARDPRAHVENEQNLVTIETPNGDVVVNQIAGLIARRIICWPSVGEKLEQGQRYGLIRFGSQVDVLVPATVTPRVKAGDRVVGGETVIAQWNKR